MVLSASAFRVVLSASAFRVVLSASAFRVVLSASAFRVVLSARRAFEARRAVFSTHVFPLKRKRKRLQNRAEHAWSIWKAREKGSIEFNEIQRRETGARMAAYTQTKRALSQRAIAEERRGYVTFDLPCFTCVP